MIILRNDIIYDRGINYFTWNLWVLLLPPLPVTPIFWVKFPLRMMFKHIVVDTAISPTAPTLSLKVQIGREKPSVLFVFNIALTAVSFLHTVIKLWQRGKCSLVTFSIIKCICPMSNNVWGVSLSGKWDCKWHRLTLCVFALDVIALVCYGMYRCVSSGIISVVFEIKLEKKIAWLSIRSFLTLLLVEYYTCGGLHFELHIRMSFYFLKKQH